MKLLPLEKRRQLAAEIYAELQRLFPGEIKTMLQYHNSWELLVSVILSAQCTDKKVNEVTPALFNRYKTLDDYINADPKEFQKYIFSTGFYRNKTKNILAAAKRVHDTFGGRVPRTMDELLTIPGVARKTANVVLGNAYGVVVGIAIDTHMKRLSRVLGLSDKTDPDKIEKDLMALLPQAEWMSFTYHLITYGRTYCFAKSHDHANCPLTKIVTKYGVY
ncbi:endonuclease III [Candidatus Microgenomates bacterium]|nr:endonuclease III [Candidatus Microgenomates bacterium]